MIAQLYSFRSVWRLPTDRSRVWHVMTALPFSWDSWWPQLTDVHDLDITPNLQGTSFSCTWQAPLGYKLRCHVTISEVIPASSVTLTVTGDLSGTVTCKLTDQDDRTQIDTSWHVTTMVPWMNRFALLLRPIFVWGHHAVMRSGERGLKKYLQATKKARD